MRLGLVVLVAAVAGCTETVEAEKPPDPTPAVWAQLQQMTRVTLTQEVLLETRHRNDK